MTTLKTNELINLLPTSSRIDAELLRAFEMPAPLLFKATRGPTTAKGAA